jgi:hypothetical protein
MVYHLTFAFVSPLSSDDSDYWHVNPLSAS